MTRWGPLHLGMNAAAACPLRFLDSACISRRGHCGSAELVRTAGESANFPTELLCSLTWF